MPKNPIEEFNSLKQRQAASRKQTEVGHWEKWKAAPEEEKPAHLQPLLKAYAPTFTRKVKEWKPPAIPESAFRAELHRQFINALDSFDPNRAALSTHVETRLQKGLRFVGRHQNMAYIPEGQTQYIGKIQRAQDQLTEDFGRPPTHDEIADHLGISPKRVGTVIKSMKKDFAFSSLEFDNTTQPSSREQEVLSLLPFSLSSDEKEIFDHIFGQNGKTKVTETNELARRLNKSPSQISRIKTSILSKYKQYR